MPNTIVAPAVCHRKLGQCMYIHTEKPGVYKGKKYFTSQILWVEVNSGYTLRRSELDLKHSLYFVKLKCVTVILMVKILFFPVYLEFYPITCWPHLYNWQKAIPLKVKAFLFHFVYMVQFLMSILLVTKHLPGSLTFCRWLTSEWWSHEIQSTVFSIYLLKEMIRPFLSGLAIF